MTLPARSGVRYTLAAFAALAFSLLYLQVCTQVGRLSRDLQYDDVGYALDAAKRWDAAMADGIPGIFRNFVDYPAHSYLPSVQGLAAFALGGVHDVSLYASNAWLLVVLALLIAFALRDRSALVGTLALLFALSSPLAYFTIAEFRPDIALGFATALMAWFLLDAGFGADRRALRWAGYLLAIALVVKSTFFAHTMAIAFGLAIAGFAATRLQGIGWMPRFALGAREVAIFFAIGIGLALPFYLLNGAHVLEYFWSNTAGAKGQVWNYAAGLSLSEVFERFKPLMFALARLQSVAAATVAILAAILLWRRGERTAAARIAALLAVAMVSAAIIVLGRQPSHFFFASMHWLVLFAGLYGFVRLHDAASFRGRRVLSALALVTIAGLAVANSTYHDVPWPPGAGHGDSWNERIVDRLEADLRRHVPSGPLPAPNVLAMTATAVNPDTLAWLARLRGFRLSAPPVHLLGDVKEGERLAAAFDYVVVPNPVATPYDGWLPVGRIQQPLIDWMRSNADFAPLGVTEGTQAYYVFANRPNTERFGAAVIDVPDIQALEHFRDEEGPYPLHKPPLPRMRWIEGKEGAVCMKGVPGAARVVVVDYVSRTPGTLTLSHEGETLTRVAIADEAAGQMTALFKPKAGRDCLRLTVQAPDNQPPLYVLVTRLAVKASK